MDGLLSNYEKIYGRNPANITSGDRLANLITSANEQTGQKTVVIIDEYDCPIQQGYMKGYYEQAVSFIRSLFSGGFKDNKHLSYGFMTGILRVAKESIFSGLNNIKVNSILEDDYSQYFGFTPEEVRDMAKYYSVPERYEEICKWYDGYRFGESHIFNPWSVIGYFNGKCVPKPFWVSTSNNDIIGDILENATDEIREKLYLLLQGKSITTKTLDTLCFILDCSVDGILYHDKSIEEETDD